MPYQVQQEDIRLLKQSPKTNYVSLELQNNVFKTIDKMEGQLVSDSYTIDADSDIRRTFTLTLVVSDSSFNIGENSKIWLNKYIKITIGTFNLRTESIVWYPVGTYLFTDTNYKYDSVSNILTLTCVDLMSKLTGLRNGQLTGLTTSIPQGSVLRDTIISVITQLGGFPNYRIEDAGKPIPYDLNFSTGATVYEILTTLRDLYAGYEMFFDIDNVFVFQPIPTCKDTDYFLVDTDLKDLVISEEVSNSFSDVKNVTEVWGQNIEADRYTDSVTMSGDTYTLTFTSAIVLSNYLDISFKASANNVANAKIKFNTSTVYNILDEDGVNIIANRIVAGKTYVVRYSNSTVKLLGQNQIYAIWKDTNADSPYNINKIGEICQIFSGGDYEKIYSDDLALERAKYENWLKTRLQDATVLEMINIPWMDVNKKILYQSKVTGVTQGYITKSINGSTTTGTMTTNIIKYYPLYPDII